MRLGGARAGIAVLAACAAAGVGCGGRASVHGAPEQKTAQQVQLAQSLMRSGRVTEALSTLDEAMRREPANAGLRMLRGEMCMNAGLLEQALESFHKALEVDPHLSVAHTYLGAVYQDLKRPADAEREYLAALASPAFPNPEKAYLGLGILYAGQGRDAEAEASLRKAVGLNPRYFAAHYELAGILERMGQLAEAVREYEVAEPGYRDSAEFLYRLGVGYVRLGQKDKARERLSRILTVAPGSESAAQAGELLKLLE